MSAPVLKSGTGRTREGKLAQTLQVEFRGFSRHVGKRFIDAAGLIEIDQSGILLRDTVGDFVRHDIERHQRIEHGKTVAEVHRAAIPVCVIVVDAVVNPQVQRWIRKRADAIPILVHLKYDAPERLSVIQWREGPVDLLHQVFWARELERGACSCGRMIEILGLHIRSLHGAVGPRGRHLERIGRLRVRAVKVVLPRTRISTWAGPVRGGQPVILQQNCFTGPGIDEHDRSGGLAGGRKEERHAIGQASPSA